MGSPIRPIQNSSASKRKKTLQSFLQSVSLGKKYRGLEEIWVPVNVSFHLHGGTARTSPGNLWLIRIYHNYHNVLNLRESQWLAEEKKCMYLLTLHILIFLKFFLAHLIFILSWGNMGFKPRRSKWIIKSPGGGPQDFYF